MKKISLILMLLVAIGSIGSGAHAEERSRARHALQMRNVGIALTVFGAVATVVGLGVYLKGQLWQPGPAIAEPLLCTIDGCPGNFGDERATAQSEMIGGAVVLTLGAAATATGIPLWVIGRRELKKESAITARFTGSGFALSF